MNKEFFNFGKIKGWIKSSFLNTWFEHTRVWTVCTLFSGKVKSILWNFNKWLPLEQGESEQEPLLQKKWREFGLKIRKVVNVTSFCVAGILSWFAINQTPVHANSITSLETISSSESVYNTLWTESYMLQQSIQQESFSSNFNKWTPVMEEEPQNIISDLQNWIVESQASITQSKESINSILTLIVQADDSVESQVFIKQAKDSIDTLLTLIVQSKETIAKAHETIEATQNAVKNTEWQIAAKSLNEKELASKKLAETKQKIIDIELKRLLILKWMKWELKHEWIPPWITDYEKYGRKQDRSLKYIKDQIQNLEIEVILADARSTTNQYDSEDIVTSKQIESNTTLENITPENITEKKMEQFIMDANDALNFSDKRESFQGAFFILKPVKVKGLSAWRVFLKHGEKSWYFTLVSGQKSRNYKYVSSTEEMLKWAEKKMKKWEK